MILFKRSFLFHHISSQIIFLMTCILMLSGNNPLHAQTDFASQANRVIDSLVKHIPQNSPKRFKKIKYLKYEELFVTADTSYSTKPFSEANEETREIIRHYLKDKDLFTSENLVEKIWIAPNKAYDKILASHVSGFKDPAFSLILSMFSDISFYDRFIMLGNTYYVNPINKGSKRKYLFILQDKSVSAQGDSLFTIYFKPLKSTNFDGLEGLMIVNQKNWGLQSIKAKPYTESNMLDITLQQTFEYIDTLGWMPMQRYFDIIIKSKWIEKEMDVANLRGSGRSYVIDIKQNPDLTDEYLGETGIEILPESTGKNEDFWDSIRPEIFQSEKRENTFSFMDSVFDIAKVEKNLTTIVGLMEGTVTANKIDFEIDKLLNFANYEGFRIGLGLATNQKFSDRYGFEAWGAYGLFDFVWKYGLSAFYKIEKAKNWKIFAGYSFDGGSNMETYFPFSKRVSFYNSAQYRHFFVDRADYTKHVRIGTSFKPIDYLQAEVGFSYKIKEPSYAYAYTPAPEEIYTDQFRYATINLGFRYAYLESSFKAAGRQMVIKSNFPVIYFNYTQSFNHILGSKFPYQKIDLKINYSLYTKLIGKSHFSVSFGKVFGSAPYSELYDGGGVFKPLTLSAANSFQTMEVNEFTNDRFIAVFFEQHFGHLLYKSGLKYFSPSPIFVTNIGWGKIDHPEYHQHVDVKSFEHGFYESGILINNIFQYGMVGVGVGMFYRYGAYQFPIWSDNVSLKISMTFAL